MALSKDKVMSICEDEDVKFIKIWFTDVLGYLKSFTISARELEGAFAEGMGFDGSSIEGFARISESDMVAMPDPNTFTILPWRPSEQGKVARMFCDVLTPDGANYDGDPRYVLKRALAKADAMGYKVFLGPELEYFYFSNDRTTQTLDKAGYFDVTPRDEATDLRRQTVIALEQMDIKVEYSHHEVAPSQHEIDLRYNEALQMADTVMTYRMTVKEMAAINGVYATFMPKPIFGQNGSGMHTHQSLFAGSKNAFFDPKDQYYLSDVAKMYIEGLLRFAPEITAVTNQWVNSYKRLVPGYEAPVYVSWARANRSALVRVPLYKPGKEAATRCELRCPDPACNPYLAFAVMISAGLKGVEEKFELRSPTEEDIFEMDEAERAAHGITSLPGSLAQAIELAEGSSLLKEALGDHVFEKFIANKKLEWDMYRTQVHQYELDKYLPLL